MAPKLDKSVLASALLRKNKGNQTQPSKVISKGSDPSVNAPPTAPLIVPSSTSKAQGRKRWRSPSSSAPVAQPSSFGGRDGRPSNHSRRHTMERPSPKVSDLRGKYLLLCFALSLFFILVFV